MQHKCECPYESTATEKRMYSPEEYSGMRHKPNECKGTNDVKLFDRNGKKMYLCSCCELFGDKVIKEQ